MRAERGDRLVLVSGDRDYVRTVKSLGPPGAADKRNIGKHATAADLRQSADDFTPLEPLFDHLTR